MARVRLHTGTGVFQVLANVCRSPQEALKQFVENSADATEQAETEEGSITIRLRHTPPDNGQKKGLLESIAIEDNGAGMTPDKMRQVLHRIGDSEKMNLALRGEQGIGLLAFALIAQELHLASSAAEGSPSRCLVLKRPWLKRGFAEIVEQCPAHQHSQRGTVAHLSGILPEIAPQLSPQHIKEYLGQQFASDLRANLYALYIGEGEELEPIHPQRFRGVKALSMSLPLAVRGASAFAELYVLPWEMPDASISLYGRGGTRICPLTELADFKMMPWLDRRLEGYIRCDRLKRTADKTALVQDKVYTSFVSELKKLEPVIQRLVFDISAESQERRFNIIVSRFGRLVDRFLRYREKGLLPLMSAITTGRGDGASREKHSTHGSEQESANIRREIAARVPTRAPRVVLQSPSQSRASYRSWYDTTQDAICINREHAEFLLSQREDRRCLRYLFSVWAKESLLREYGAQAEKVADEMVGILAEAEPLL